MAAWPARTAGRVAIIGASREVETDPEHTSAGELGRAVAETLNKINGGVTEAVYRRLGLERGCRVLETCFGNGRLLPALMRQAEEAFGFARLSR